MSDQAAPANARQVGGDHYQSKPIQPWDFILANGLGFLEGCVVKYVTRWRHKGGIEDLKKARHYLDKLIEWEEGLANMPDAIPAFYVVQIQRDPPRYLASIEWSQTTDRMSDALRCGTETEAWALLGRYASKISEDQGCPNLTVLSSEQRIEAMSP